MTLLALRIYENICFASFFAFSSDSTGNPARLFRLVCRIVIDRATRH